MLDLVSEVPFPSLAKGKLSTNQGADKADKCKNPRGLTGLFRQRTSTGNFVAQEAISTLFGSDVT